MINSLENENNNIWNYKILLTVNSHLLDNKITIEKYYYLYNEIKYIFHWFYKYYKKFIILLSKNTNDFINENHKIDNIYKKYNIFINNNLKTLIISIFKNNNILNNYSLKLKLLIIKLLNIYQNNLENSKLNKYTYSIRKNLNILYKINNYFEIDKSLIELFNKVKILETIIYKY